MTGVWGFGIVSFVFGRFGEKISFDFGKIWRKESFDFGRFLGKSAKISGETLGKYRNGWVYGVARVVIHFRGQNMKRTIDAELAKWANEADRKPLLLRGARQVGKTYAVRKLGRKFKRFIELNFDDDPSLDALFRRGLPVEQLADAIGAYARQKIEPGETLLFLDEVQASPAALAELRYFRERMPGLHVVAAGSLLEFALQDIPSLGVGRITSRFMYPMTYREFLDAIGEGLLGEAIDGAGVGNPLPEPLHLRAISHLRTHMAIGGLPEIVAGYAKNRSLLDVMDGLDDLLLLFHDDFGKYRRRVPAVRLAETFKALANQAGGKFVYSKVLPGVKSTAIGDALEMLVKAGLALKAYRTGANGIPLGAEGGGRGFKACLADLGLHQRALGLDMRSFATLDDAEFANRGSLAEVYAAIELAACGSVRHRPELYYWQREALNATAEVDYVVQLRGEAIPVEVKSGVRGSMKSLHSFIAEKGASFGVRVSLENFGEIPAGKVKIMPLYAMHRMYEMDWRG